MSELIDNKAGNRFELHVDDMVVYADYRKQESDLFIDYVFAPVPLRGTGASERLMQSIADLAHDQALKVTPICGYAALWLKRHAPNVLA
ncbi:MAG: GNAT family N-acetyltransferase [Asticcacaulis sp.]